MNTVIKLAGYVWVRKNGVLVREGSNLIVDTGLSLLADIIETNNTRPSHMAIGTATAAATAAQTDLQGTEEERVALTAAQTGNVLTYSASFGAGIVGTPSIAEYGIFNDATSGTMLCRFTGAAVSIDSSDTLDVTWSITIGV